MRASFDILANEAGFDGLFKNRDLMWLR